MENEEELNYCPCCDCDKPADDGDNCFNKQTEEDSWICRDCLDTGVAEEEGWE